MGQILLFAADDGNIGTELWAIDVGATGGARLVRDIQPGTFLDDGLPSANGAGIGGRAVFLANDGVHGGELWVSDGTAGGTRLLKDILPGDDFSGSTPLDFVTIGNRAFFTANEAEHGRELWVTDGTAGGTRMVRDIRPGEFSSNIDSILNLNGKALFVANDGTTGYELWVSDGTEGGTTLLKDISPLSGGVGTGAIIQAGIAGNRAFFVATDDTHGHELWVTDGTTGGTRMVQDSTPGNAGSNLGQPVVAGGLAFYSAWSVAEGFELWRSDGTDGGTFRITDTRPGVDYGSPSALAAFGNRLLFVDIDDAGGWEPWISDGTAQGTRQLRDIAPGTDSSVSAIGLQYHVLGTSGRAIFVADTAETGRELWVTDGTTQGTRLLRDINAGDWDSNPDHITVVGNRAYFQASDTNLGDELWMTDGTTAGTVLVSDTRTGALPGFAFPIAVINGPDAPDPIVGNGGANRLNGTGAGERMDGKGGADVMNGRGGADRMQGGAGRDKMNGGDGDDVLDGGPGNDRLTGAAGADTFRFAGKFGRDVITDFGRGADRIDLTGRGLAFDDLNIRAADNGRDSIIDVGRNRITLQGIQPDDLDAGMFNL